MKTLPRGESRFCFGRRLRALVCGGFGLVGVVAWLPLSAQTLFLNDTFADSERLTQSLPSSAHWYLGNSGVASVSSLSGLTTNAQLTLEDIVANFTSGTGTAQSLNVGDTLTLNFTFGVTGAVDSFVSGFNRGFRVGLLNSNGAVYKDAGLYDSYYNGFAGYFAALNLKTSGAAGDGVPIALIKRSATDGTVQFANPDKTDLVGKSFLILNNAFPSSIVPGTSTNPYSTLGTGGSMSTLNQIEGTSYTGALTLFRDTTSSMVLNLSVNGGTLSGYSAIISDTESVSPIFTAFNTIAIGYTTGELNTFTLQNASVIYTAVPESSTYAVIVGAFALMGATIRRRRGAVR